MEDPVIVFCPHCQGIVVVQQINCAIFRHGVFRNSGEQIPPHSSKLECTVWSERQEIWGCGKPFQVVKNIDNKLEAIICEYI
jgi:hypothetical protein